MKKFGLYMSLCACFIAACNDDDDNATNPANCGNGIIDQGEECDGDNSIPTAITCDFLVPGSTGKVTCSKTCTFDTSSCGICNHNGVKDADEECDGEDFGSATCATLNPKKTFGKLGCSQSCKIVTHYCSASDLGLQAPNPDAEQTDEQCSNGKNDFNTVNKDGTPSNWFDCKNHSCMTSPLVQVCQATENNDMACSDGIDNPTASGLPSGMSKVSNGLIDCQDPSCFKNWRVTVCQDVAPKWELGDDCKDGLDNDGDTLIDCDDPDCLHAGSPCDLGSKSRVLFDNAHHQIAGTVDWIIDVTGRHPYPSKPEKENDWHGSLSAWGKDLLDSGNFILETLPQDRTFTYGDKNQPQDLTQYQIVVSVEPSSKYKPEEIKALHDFVKDGGSLMLFADHKGADRDGNGVDAVDAINDLLQNLPGATSLDSNPFGFSVLDNSSMATDTAKPAPNAIAEIVANVTSTGSYAGTAFQILDDKKVTPILLTSKDNLNYVIAVQYEKGRIVAVGDSSITGDGTNFLGIQLKNAAYKEYSNKTFLINAMNWLRHQ